MWRRLSAMAIFFFFLVILAIAALSIPFGRESRDLRDQHWETPWERLPR